MGVLSSSFFCEASLALRSSLSFFRRSIVAACWARKLIMYGCNPLARCDHVEEEEARGEFTMVKSVRP